MNYFNRLKTNIHLKKVFSLMMIIIITLGYSLINVMLGPINVQAAVGDYTPISINIPANNTVGANSSVTGTTVDGENLTITRVTSLTDMTPIPFKTSGTTGDVLVQNADLSTNWTSGGTTPALSSVPPYIRFDSRDNNPNTLENSYVVKFTFASPVLDPVFTFSGTANKTMVSNVEANLIASKLVTDASSGGTDGTNTLPVPTATDITNGVVFTGSNGTDRFNGSLLLKGYQTEFVVSMNPTTNVGGLVQKWC
jgi:hypothetical protein